MPRDCAGSLAEGLLIVAGPCLGPVNTGIAIFKALDEGAVRNRRPGAARRARLTRQDDGGFTCRQMPAHRALASQRSSTLRPERATCVAH